MVDFVEGFKKDCAVRGLTDHTIETYICAVKDYLEYFPDPVHVQLDDLKNHLGMLRLRGLQGSTLKGRFAALSALYDYLVFEGISKTNPVLPFRKRYLSRIKRQYGGENTRQLISIEAMKGLINSIEDINIKTMLLFLAKTGLRRGELIAMDIQDINLVKGEFWIKPKAKRTNRAGFLDPEMVIALEYYLEWRESKAKDSALWVTSDGKRVSRNYVYYSVIEYASKQALHDPNGPLKSKFTPHCFRHFFTTHLRRSGMPREFIQELRGDHRKEAIDIYDHIDVEELRTSYLKHVFKLNGKYGRDTSIEEWCCNSVPLRSGISGSQEDRTKL